MNQHIVDISSRFTIGGGQRFVLIAGPCAIENRDMTLHTARTLREVCERLNIRLIFKASYDKANRTSLSAERGVGMEQGLQILQEVKDSLHLPILTDVHEAWQCPVVAEVADVLQIPAFLCRQTDLLVAAAQTGRVVNVKKGQFLAPWDMRNVVNKLEQAGAHDILLTERGTSFGYNNLVVDMTSLVEMAQLGYPVVFDATHSVQKPGGQGNSTGGNRAMVPYLMRAALATGVDAIFAEVHPDPDHAISDGPNQLYLSTIEQVLRQAIAIDDAVKSLQPIERGVAHLVPTPPAYPYDTIKLLISDVDGVLTDAGMYYSEQGDELKKFNTHDGMGLQLLQKAGVKVGVITSERTQLMERRAQKLGLDYLIQGKRNGGKLEALREICQQEHIDLSEVAYIGDDVNCAEILRAVGFAACPSDAMPIIKQIPNIHVMHRKGGEGCVRELTDQIINEIRR